MIQFDDKNNRLYSVPNPAHKAPEVEFLDQLSALRDLPDGLIYEEASQFQSDSDVSPFERLALWKSFRVQAGVGHPDHARFSREAFRSGLQAFTHSEDSVELGLVCWGERREYLHVLLSHESSAYLTDGSDIDNEVDHLLYDGKTLRYLTIRDFDSTLVEQRNIALFEQVVSELVLPRYRWWLALRVAYQTTRGRVRVGVAVLGVASCVLFAASITLLAKGTTGRAIAGWISVISLGTLLLAAFIGGPLTMHALCLRLLASCAVGQAIVTAFLIDNDSFKATDRTSTELWAPPVALLLVIFLYLLLEARLHRVPPAAALRRVCWVLGLGSCYALTLGCVIVSLVLPGFRADDRWLGTQEGMPFASMLVTVSLMGLLVGLLTQVLWDDRPITAPLGRKRWNTYT